MRLNSKRKCMVTRLSLALCFVCHSSPGKQKVAAAAWAGQYKWVSGNFLMTIENLGSDLGVHIRDLEAKPYPPSGDHASFVARISGNIARFRELRDPKNCRIDLRRVPEGIVLENHCGGRDRGLYVRSK